MDENELTKIWPESSGLARGKCAEWKNHAPHAWQVMGQPEPVRWDPNAEIPTTMPMPPVHVFWCWGVSRGSR